MNLCVTRRESVYSQSRLNLYTWTNKSCWLKLVLNHIHECERILLGGWELFCTNLSLHANRRICSIKKIWHTFGFYEGIDFASIGAELRIICPCPCNVSAWNVMIISSEGIGQMELNPDNGSLIGHQFFFWHGIGILLATHTHIYIHIYIYIYVYVKKWSIYR